MPHSRLAALGIQCVLGAGLALASPALLAHPHGPPPGADNPHAQKHRQEYNDKQGPNIAAQAPGQFFNGPKRAKINAYYARQFKKGRCPPGLAKKHDGCLPPGQARQWHVGQPLPVSVTAYPVPAVVIRILGTPPLGYRYVRVADNLLLMATGTRMVVDAIRDLGH